MRLTDRTDRQIHKLRLLRRSQERAVLRGRSRRGSPVAAGVPFPAAAVRAAQEARRANPLLASRIAAILCGCVVSDALLESNQEEGILTTCDHCGEQHVPTLDHMYSVCTANADLQRGITIPTADLTRRLGWPTENLTRRTTTTPVQKMCRLWQACVSVRCITDTKRNANYCNNLDPMRAHVVYVGFTYSLGWCFLFPR